MKQKLTHGIKRIVVIGSSNTDMVIRTKNLPRPGETVLGGTFFMNAGGKGANQAVACARLGGAVTFVCKTGNDVFGHQAYQLFDDEGIDPSYVFSDPKNPSGVALILVDDNAENSIAVASGSNSNLVTADIDNSLDAIENSEIVLMQLEIPIKTIEYAAQIAKSRGKMVILNPAPAPTEPLPLSILKNIDLITPNETEAELISGIPVVDETSAIAAAKRMAELGVKKIIITMGSKGAMLYEDGEAELIPSIRVKAVDTTAAGDCFNGALTIAISEGRSLKDAVLFANRAAAISVTRPGAQVSMPYRHEVDVANF
jgi:ribokinase